MAMTRLAAKIMLTGIPQYRIADEIGVSQSKLSEWINGRALLPARLLMPLCVYLRCNPDDIMGWTDDGEIICMEDGIDTALVRRRDERYASPIKYAAG